VQLVDAHFLLLSSSLEGCLMCLTFRSASRSCAAMND
jgi:hypothetical protein